jgi:hypothetical protein
MRFKLSGLLVAVAIAVMVMFFLRVGLDLRWRRFDLGEIGYVFGVPVILGSVCAALIIGWRRWHST